MAPASAREIRYRLRKAREEKVDLWTPAEGGDLTERVVLTVSLRPLEELFRSRVITFLVEKGLPPGVGPDAAQLEALRLQLPPAPAGGSRRRPGPGTARPVNHPQPLLPGKDAPYRLRRHRLPLQAEPQDQAQLYGLPPRLFHRRRHPAHPQQVKDPGPKVPGNFQLVRYYGWHSNKMCGRGRSGPEREEVAGEQSVEVIDVPGHQPRRIPSKKWWELIKCSHPDREADRGRSGRPILSSAPTAERR